MTRRANDWYPTPSWATEMLLARIDLRGEVLEPCSGDGAISNVLSDEDSPADLVYRNDLDTKWEAEFHGDAACSAWWKTHGRQWDWVVSNPPFNVAHKIVPLAFEHAFDGVAMLLRLSYLEPCAGRGRWLVEHPPSKLIVLPRISFTGDGKTDSVTCAWYVWQRHETGQSFEVVPSTPDGQLSLLHPETGSDEYRYT